MSSLRLPKDKGEARRVVYETLGFIRTKLGLRKGTFNSLANEIMMKMYSKKKTGKHATLR